MDVDEAKVFFDQFDHFEFSSSDEDNPWVPDYACRLCNDATPCRSLKGYCEDCWYFRIATDEEKAQYDESVTEAECETEAELERMWEARKEHFACRFQTLARMLLGFKRWSQRAVARVEAEYAPDGRRGKQIIQQWSAIRWSP